MDTEEVWILGGTGRSARVIATELIKRGLTPVLVGRDPTRLAEAAQTNGPARTVVAASVDDMAAAIRRDRPAVVINTVGPFATTAGPIARACLAAHGHYLDLANDVAAVSAVLALDAQAQAAAKTLVTGAGFGVTATESVVVKLTGQLTPGRQPPASVRVDMIPSLATEAGPLGEALAATMVDGFPDARGRARYQGRQYKDGRLTPARLASAPVTLTLPDGSNVTTTGMPLGELVAAHRATGAPDVISASSEIPSSPIVRVILPIATTLLTISPIRAFARRRLARVNLKPRERPRPYSYGHARLTWPDGHTQEGWLRLGDAQAFTGIVPAEIARRLLHHDGGDGHGDGHGDAQVRPGAFTPAALFGPTLAESCGAEYLTPNPQDDPHGDTTAAPA